MTQKERCIKGKMADKISYRHLKLQRVCHRAMFIWLYGKKGLKKKKENLKPEKWETIVL